MEIWNRISYAVVFTFVILLVSLQTVRRSPNTIAFRQPTIRSLQSHLRNFTQSQQKNSDYSTPGVQPATHRPDNHTFKVLQYTRFFVRWMPTGKTLFDGCEYSNCVLTIDKKELLASDALLFHLRTMGKLPTQRLPHQKWIAAVRESPVHVGVRAAHSALFNATATYSKRSDVLHPYGRIIPGTMPTGQARLSSNKTKMAAWIVSNCGTSSKREKYVAQLKKYMEVDVYGGCGKLKCPKTKGHGPEDPCLEMIERDYRFYFSFENSVCESYVSEKLYKVLFHDVVPVVLGGADYKEMLPPNSYIDVANFSSPRLLAEYLHRVSNDDALYDSYFAWKSSFSVDVNFDKVFGCSLCEFMNRSYKKTTIVPSMGQFWSRKTYCQGSAQYYSSFLNMSDPENSVFQ